MGDVDGHSIKGSLLPPTPDQLARLAKAAQNLKPTTEPIEKQKSTSRSLRRRLTPAELKELADKYESGDSVSTLSCAYAISRPGVRQILHTQGVTRRKRGMSNEDADRAVRLYEKGHTIMEVVDEIGSSYGVVNRMLHKRGVNVRPRRNQD